MGVLGEEARASIEAAYRQRLGLLARAGSYEGALWVTRRTLLRERSRSGQLASAWGNAERQGQDASK